MVDNGNDSETLNVTERYANGQQILKYDKGSMETAPNSGLKPSSGERALEIIKKSSILNKLAYVKQSGENKPTQQRENTFHTYEGVERNVS